MPKFYGKIGFGITETKETSPDVWETVPVEKNYYGEILRNINKNESSGNVNDNSVITNIFSIVANPFAVNNFQQIKYVIYKGYKWKALNSRVEYPRIIITVGGEYVD